MRAANWPFPKVASNAEKGVPLLSPFFFLFCPCHLCPCFQLRQGPDQIGDLRSKGGKPCPLLLLTRRSAFGPWSMVRLSGCIGRSFPNEANIPGTQLGGVWGKRPRTEAEVHWLLWEKEGCRKGLASLTSKYPYFRYGIPRCVDLPSIVNVGAPPWAKTGPLGIYRLGNN